MWAAIQDKMETEAAPLFEALTNRSNTRFGLVPGMNSRWFCCNNLLYWDVVGQYAWTTNW